MGHYNYSLRLPLSLTLESFRKGALYFTALWLPIFYSIIFFKISLLKEYTNTITIFGDAIAGLMIFVGVFAHTKMTRFPWMMFFLSSMFYLTGDIVWAVKEDFLGIEVKTPSLSDAFYYINIFLILAGACIYIKRLGGFNYKIGLMDIFITIFALSGIVLNYLIFPFIQNNNLNAFEVFLLIFYPVIDLIYIIMTIIMVIGTRHNFHCSKVTAFLIVAYLSMFITNILGIIDMFAVADIGMVIEPLWSFCYLLLGIASLYPEKEPYENEINIRDERQAKKEGIFFIKNPLVINTINISKFVFPYTMIIIVMLLLGYQNNTLNIFLFWTIFMIVLISGRQIYNNIKTFQMIDIVEAKKEELKEKNIELSRLNRKISSDAEIDFLTQLYNRRYIDNKIKEIAPDMKWLHKDRRKHKENERVGVMLIDVDFFKQVNDTYGHDVGDKVLQYVASSIKSSIREHDIAGRYGGDEFVVILPSASEENIHIVADRLVSNVRENYELKDKKVTLSIGCAAWDYSNKEFDVKKLFKNADIALYIAKENGRNQYAVFSEELMDIFE